MVLFEPTLLPLGQVKLVLLRFFGLLFVFCDFFTLLQWNTSAATRVLLINHFYHLLSVFVVNETGFSTITINLKKQIKHLSNRLNINAKKYLFLFGLYFIHPFSNNSKLIAQLPLIFLQRFQARIFQIFLSEFTRPLAPACTNII